MNSMISYSRVCTTLWYMRAVYSPASPVYLQPHSPPLRIMHAALMLCQLAIKRNISPLAGDLCMGFMSIHVVDVVPAVY